MRLAEEKTYAVEQDVRVDEGRAEAHDMGRRQTVHALATAAALSTTAAQRENHQSITSLRGIQRAYEDTHWTALLCQYSVEGAKRRLGIFTMTGDSSRLAQDDVSALVRLNSTLESQPNSGIHGVFRLAVSISITVPESGKPAAPIKCEWLTR